MIEHSIKNHLFPIMALDLIVLEVNIQNEHSVNNFELKLAFVFIK